MGVVMTAMEITLLVLGAVVFFASFIIPEIKSGSNENSESNQEEIKKAIDAQMGTIKTSVQVIVDETVTHAIENTERALDKLSNEKIMAVNEYSDTVLSEINKNHKEVIFLYDMLSNKQVDLKNTVRKVEQTKIDAKVVAKAISENPMEPNEKSINRQMKKNMNPIKENKVEIKFEVSEDNGKNKNEKILSLRKQGKSNVAIAKELGLGVGEVKLVIDLFEGVQK
ncbi:MAG: DUF6115 domain-containing protein [Lachnospiraceae bacterium]|nr:DUF6115 domain-containing protein [Lachnospiraceae bacterium]